MAAGMSASGAAAMRDARRAQTPDTYQAAIEAVYQRTPFRKLVGRRASMTSQASICRQALRHGAACQSYDA